MRDLTDAERAGLLHLADMPSELVEVGDNEPINEELVAQGLVRMWVGLSPDGDGEAQFWEINARGILALRVDRATRKNGAP